ncbi:hypothetical protein TWF696_008877 [Orbilia brochopaga]|uniref:Uncharacterized protein n=1 Tax=Orbilia brochopaga TaxID=3140254 RepID=A0AAV9UDM0_9PEZI
MLSGKSVICTMQVCMILLMLFASLTVTVYTFVGSLGHSVAPPLDRQGPPGDEGDQTSAVKLSAKCQAREVLAECKSRGNDVFAGIPSDAKLIPIKRTGNSDNRWGDDECHHPRVDVFDVQKDQYVYVHAFEAGSNASLWASAQVFANQFPELFNNTERYHKLLEERGPRKLGVGLWEG